MFMPVEVTESEAELRARWQAQGDPAWADGDRLTVVCESEAAHVVLWPVFQQPMQRVGDRLFAWSARVRDLDRALISYAFWEVDEAGMPASERPPDPAGRYRGPNARPEAPANRPPKGSLTTHTVESDHLQYPRQVEVYLPPGHDTGADLPVVYATDGGLSFIGYIRRLDAAIELGATPPVAVVAAHSAGASARRGNLRGMEYLPGFDDVRFNAHRRFFTAELPTWAEAELGVRSDRAGRAVFGCSDGAVHALTLAEELPDFAGTVIAYSGGMPPQPTTGLDPATAPFLHLGAGTLEEGFFLASKAWDNWCVAMDIPHTFTETVAGHDLIQWCENLPHAVAAAFG